MSRVNLPTIQTMTGRGFCSIDNANADEWSTPPKSPPRFGKASRRKSGHFPRKRKTRKLCGAQFLLGSYIHIRCHNHPSTPFDVAFDIS